MHLKLSMALVDVIGLIASFFVLSAFVPQIAKSYRTKKMGDVSYYLMAILIASATSWMVYGYLKNDYIIIGVNAGVFLLNLTLVLMKYKYSK